MKKQIRYNTFETNSSSIHTLQISSDLMRKSILNIKSDGYIHVHLNQYYGKEAEDFVSQEDKLKYVCTWMYIYNGCRNLNDIDNDWIMSYWQNFVHAFCNYVNKSNINNNKCIGIKVYPDNGDEVYDYLDHQSVPYGLYDDDNCVVDLYNTEQLINFIFNPYMSLHTDCD